MTTTLEAMHVTVKTLESRVMRVEDRMGEQEKMLVEVRDMVRDLKGEYRFIKEDRARLIDVPARIDVVENAVRSNAETLSAVVRASQETATTHALASEATRAAWIGPEGFFRSRSFMILLAIVLTALLILLRALNPQAVVDWWHGPGPQIIMQPSPADAPRGIGELSVLP